MSRPRPVPCPAGLRREERIEDPVADRRRECRTRCRRSGPRPAWSRGRPRPRRGPTRGRRRARCRSGFPRSGSARRRIRGRAAGPAPPRRTRPPTFRAPSISARRPCCPGPGPGPPAPRRAPWSMCVKPLTARTRPAIRVAASWISEARRRTEHPAAAQRSAASSAGPSTAAASRSRVLDRHGGLGEGLRRGRVEAAVGEPVADGFLALGVLDRRPDALLGRGRARRCARASIASNWASVSSPTRRARASPARRRRPELSEQRRAALDRGRGVVQLVGEPRREPSERDHLLVVQLVRREVPRPIDHPVDEDRRQRGTLPDQGGHVLAGHDEAGPRAPGRPHAPAN